MPTTILDVRDRIGSICASDPFQFVQSGAPFDFDSQPTGQIDQCFRVTSQSDRVIGGFNYSEDRTDTVDIWIARKQAGDPNVMYRLFQADASSIRSAVIRDGSTGGGDFTVPDGGGFSVRHDNGREYAVLRVSLPVNYEAQL